VINVDKNAAYPKAMADLKAAGMLSEGVELRQVNYLNNPVEQNHRLIKRLVKPGLGFFSVETAGRTLQGYEGINMIRKGQVRGRTKETAAGRLPSSPARLKWLPKPNKKRVRRPMKFWRCFCNTTSFLASPHRHLVVHLVGFVQELRLLQ
jgi:DDE domain